MLWSRCLALVSPEPAVAETARVRHLRLESPILLKMDGRRREGVILKPLQEPLRPE